MRAARNTRWFLPLVIGGLMVLLLPAVAFAATEADKQQAIDDGLKYLITQQQTDGHFEYGGVEYDNAATGAALLAFLEEGYTAGTDVVIGGTNYGDVVGKSVDYLMRQAQPYTISNQPAGNPDGDGNGIGVKFNLGGNNSRDTYVTGIVMTALARTNPNALVSTGALSTRTDGSGAGGAWTMKDVVQNTMDWFAYGQVDGGSGRGGWRYYANYGDSDNSTAQWGAIGPLFAESMGVTAPQFMKDELDTWTDYIQYMGGTPGTGIHGSSGYSSPTSLNNHAKTGGLLAEMLFTGEHTLTDSQVQAAIDYLDRNWSQTQSGTWYGNFGHPYAMWSVYKGLEGWIGLDGDLSAYITPRAQGSAVIDTGDTWNWWEDYCEWLVQNQGSSGAWGGYSYWGGPLATAWNINILNATSVQEPTVPEPSTIALLGLGLAGVAFAARRRRRAS